MPQAFLAFVGQVGSLIIQGAVAIFGPEVAVVVLDYAAKLGALQLLGYVSGKLAKSPDFASSAQGTQLLIKSTVEHQKVVYGRTLVGGTIAYANSAGTHNQALFHDVVVAGHEINDITDMWLDDNQIPEGYIDWGTDGGVNSGDYRGDTAYQTPVFFEKNLGASGQLASNVLSNFFTEVTSEHVGGGIAHFVARFDYSEGQTQVWSGGLPTLIRGLVEGKLVYDPRSDSTQSFGTGPHRLTNSLTWEFSRNPALHWADYLIDDWHGPGISYSKIDYGYVASTAEHCEGVVYTPVGTDVRYACDGVLSDGDTHLTNINKILSSFNGAMTRAGGVYRVHPFAYTTPTLQFTEAEMRDDLQIALDPDEDDRYNSVRGVFIDKDRLYEPQQIPLVQSSEYLNRDGGVVKYEDIQLPMTQDVYMAQRLAFGVLEMGNFTDKLIYPSKFKALPVEINGTLMLSVGKTEWTNKEFRCLQYGLDDLKGGIDLILREEDSDAYTDVSTAEYTVASQGGYVSADPGVPAPTSFYVENIAEGVHLHWTPPPARLYEESRIWRNTVNSFGNASQLYITRADNYIDNPTHGLYHYWVDAINYAGEVSSPTASVEGLFLQEATLVGDPGFEASPVNTPFGNGQFWSGVNTVTAGWGNGHAVINSEDVGVGGTHHLHVEAVPVPGSGGFFSSPFSTKYANIVRGMDVHVWMRYRVPVYSDLTSAFIDLPITGRRSLRNSTTGTMQETRINVTNSTDWVVHSDSISQNAFTNVESFSLMRLGAQINAYGDVNTGTLEVDIDEMFLAYVKG